MPFVSNLFLFFYLHSTKVYTLESRLTLNNKLKEFTLSLPPKRNSSSEIVLLSQDTSSVIIATVNQFWMLSARFCVALICVQLPLSVVCMSCAIC